MTYTDEHLRKRAEELYYTGAFTAVDATLDRLRDARESLRILLAVKCDDPQCPAGPSTLPRSVMGGMCSNCGERLSHIHHLQTLLGDTGEVK